ncbi:MAG: sensor histidine kinase [Burkholderiaceae bacterium]
MATLKLRWWLTVIFCLGTLVSIQVWSGNHVKNRTDELQSYLDQAYSLSLGLTRALGYGGLIHNLKNQVLRPRNPSYAVNARKDATNALRLVDGLERSAHYIGVTTKLSATRTMIAAYSERLGQLPELVGRGLSPSEVDAQIQFDDHDAIREIDVLVGQLRASVSDQIKSIGLQGSALHWTSSAATTLLILVLLVQRSMRIRDLKSIRKLNGKLTDSVKNLGEANTSLKQFAGIVSHDLKAPLRHIGFFGTLIEEDIGNTEDVKKHIGSITESIARMDRMIESLLEFTRTGFTEPDLQPVSIASIADAAINELEPAILDKSAVVSTDLAGELLADASLMGRVFENLIGNSLKYARTGVAPHILVKSWQDEDSMNISVSDNGIGIDPQYAERIFEPFQRLHGSSAQFEGSGIGLSLVKTVVEVHGGAVRLDPDYQDGTCVVVQIPVARGLVESIPQLELT